MLCLLKGAYRFFTVLVNELSTSRLNCDHGIDVEFIRLKSYENSESTGTIQIIGVTDLNKLRGKNVLVIRPFFQ